MKLNVTRNLARFVCDDQDKTNPR